MINALKINYVYWITMSTLSMYAHTLAENKWKNIF